MADTVKYIFAEPETVDGISIYPVQMRDYDEFMNVANVLTYSYDHFDMDGIREFLEGNEIKLLDLLIFNLNKLGQGEIVIESFTKIFSFVCKQKIEYVKKFNAFLIKGTDLAIDQDNYDEIREIILRQNLIFAPKVYKDPMTQRRAEKVLKHRAKTSLNTSVESMIAILTLSGIPLQEIKTYSIYTLKTLFNYKLKYENYKTLTLFQTVDTSGKINPEHFAEEIDMFVNPYADIFKKKSSFTNLKQAGFDLDKAK